ncbi:MAG: hypothetical protein P4L96_09495 [Rhodoferax sp.]|nr:hypothetical protein [Rhodoferax sp.]
MTEFFGLRPEDFQKAWANAYQSALQQVAVLQEFSEQQLTSATGQVLWARQAVEVSVRELDGVRTCLVEAMERAAQLNAAALHDAAAALAHEAQQLIRRDQALQAEVARQKQLLGQARADIEAARRRLLRGSLWRRLVWAFWPH